MYIPPNWVRFYPSEKKLLPLITINLEDVKTLPFWRGIFSLLKRYSLFNFDCVSQGKNRDITEGICMLYSKKFLYLLSGSPANEKKSVVHTYKHIMLSKTQLKICVLTLKLCLLIVSYAIILCLQFFPDLLFTITALVPMNWVEEERTCDMNPKGITAKQVLSESHSSVLVSSALPYSQNSWQ